MFSFLRQLLSAANNVFLRFFVASGRFERAVRAIVVRAEVFAHGLLGVVLKALPGFGALVGETFRALDFAAAIYQSVRTQVEHFEHFAVIAPHRLPDLQRLAVGGEDGRCGRLNLVGSVIEFARPHEVPLISVALAVALLPLVKQLWRVDDEPSELPRLVVAVPVCRPPVPEPAILSVAPLRPDV